MNLPFGPCTVVAKSNHALMYQQGNMYYIGRIDEPGEYHFATNARDVADNFMDAVERFVVDSHPDGV